MEDIYITVPFDSNISKNLVKALEKYPLISKTNGYRGVFFHKKTINDVTYVVRYGRVRETNFQIRKNLKRKECSHE